MRSRPLLALLSLLPLSALYGQTPQLPDSLQVDSLPVTTEHILAPESVSSKALARIDSLAEAGLRMGAYPGCQIFAFYQGEVLVNKAYGRLRASRGDRVSLLRPKASMISLLSRRPLLLHLL